MKKSIRVGAGLGFYGDAWEPVLASIDRGGVQYIASDHLAELTLAILQKDLQRDSALGYARDVVPMLLCLWPAMAQQKVRFVCNAGGLNPAGAAAAVRAAFAEKGWKARVAVVTGDEVLRQLKGLAPAHMFNGGSFDAVHERMVFANAYLGARPIVSALRQGADIVITGRVADPSLFVGAALHGLDWSYDDYPMLAAATLAGHLMECSAQLTGGCFMDPGMKDVEDPVNIGFPYADLGRDGSLMLGKLETSGGRLDVMTCTEQLLYEMHDPAAYITPDCVLDITGVEFGAQGRHRVRATGAQARARTSSYKVVVGYHDGYIGEGEVGYSGPNALPRAKLAEHIVRERLRLRGFSYPEIRVDYIGMSSMHGMGDGRDTPYEVRLRVAARSADRKAAQAVGFEVRALHVNGPAGGGGGSNAVREVLAVKSLLLDRALVRPVVTVDGAT